MRDSGDLAVSALDAVSAHVAVVDRNATVVLCNEAWNRFARANGAAGVDWLGWNYLGVCSIAKASGDESAGVIGRALEELLAGGSERRVFDYPCHSPTSQRWFLRERQGFSNHAVPDRPPSPADAPVRSRYRRPETASAMAV